MNATALMNRQVTLLRRVQVVDDGDPGYTEVETPTRCELQPAVAAEAQGGAILQDRWRLFLPPATASTGWDAVRDETTGTVFELDGDPGLFTNPRTGVPSHVEAIVKVAH